MIFVCSHPPVLGIGFMVSCTLNKCSTTELHPKSLVSCLSEDTACFVVQPGLKLETVSVSPGLGLQT